MKIIKRIMDWIFPAILFLLLSLVIVKNGIPSLYEPGRDGGMFIYFGRQILHGKLLYIDIWDNKGPLIFYINSLGLLLGRGTRWGVWFLELFFLMMSSFIGYSLLKRKWGVVPALAGVTVGLIAAYKLFGSGNYSEEYSILFTWISIYAFLQAVSNPEKRQFPIIMGAMVILNFMLRANNIATSASVLLVWIIYVWIKHGRRKALSQSFWVFIGILITALPFIAYFVYLGTLDDLVKASITYNFSYSFSTHSEGYKFNVLESSILPALKALKIWMIIPLIGYLYTLINFGKGNDEQKQPLHWFILMAWPFEIISSSISGRGYGHYFICWLPIMTLASGAFFFYFQRYFLHPDFVALFNERRPQLSFLCMIVLLLTIFGGDYYLYLRTTYRIIYRHDHRIEYLSPVAEYISSNTNPEDEILVWGGQLGINYMSHRNSSTGYHIYPLYPNTGFGIDLQKFYYQDLVNNRPVLIIDASKVAPDELPSLHPEIFKNQRILYPLAQNTQQTLDYISENYECVEEVDGYSIFRLKQSDTGS